MRLAFFLVKFVHFLCNYFFDSWSISTLAEFPNSLRIECKLHPLSQIRYLKNICKRKRRGLQRFKNSASCEMNKAEFLKTLVAF